MRAQLEAIMHEHGQDLTVIRRESGGEIAVRAFVQPLLKENAELPVTATPLGAVSDHRWLYIGPAAVELEAGDRVHRNDGRFVVQESMAVCFRQEALYERAILRREKEAAR